MAMLISKLQIKNYIIILLSFLLLIYATAPSRAYAVEKQSRIIDELSTLTIDGKKFDVNDYPAYEEGSIKLLNLYESGYNPTNQEHYGVILYIYNPALLDIKDDLRNTVQIITGNAERSAKYNIRLIELSEDKLFAKFLINFTTEQKSFVLSTLNKDGRIYDVNNVELYITGSNAENFTIERTYTYTGSEASDNLTESLSYTETAGIESVPLTVKHTTWRPEGNNGKSEFTQDSLHSVYFAIPNEYDDRYDYLKSVECNWIEALTSPIFVTGNQQIYEAVDELITTHSILYHQLNTVPKEFNFQNFNYAFMGGITDKQHMTGQVYDYYCKIAVNKEFSTTGNPSNAWINHADEELKTLYWNFPCEGSIYEHTISSAEIFNYIENYDLFFNDKQVANKYPSYLFDSWSNEIHSETIDVGENYTLTSAEVRQTWWEKLWNSSHIEKVEDFKNIQAIQQVESLTGNISTDCANYYIGESDYEEFKKYYDANKADSTIYLLRFATSEYTVMQVQTIGDKKGLTWYKDVIDTNSYLAQTNVYLNFDIINLEYMKGNKSYILPVSMSPIDIFPNLTPPPKNPDNQFWIVACCLILLLTATGFVYAKLEKEKNKA